MRKFVFLALICCCTAQAFAQKIVINGKNGNRKLEWADFTGVPDANSTFYAHTWYTLRYSYNNVVTNGDQATIGGFEAILELDPNKSWVRTEKTTDELLVHEQGHFNIGIMCMRELIATVNETSFSKSDYAEAMRNIFRDVMRKYNDMNVQYDNETDHYKNKEQQQKWNALFAERLDQETYQCMPCGSDCDNEAYNSTGKCKHCGMDLVKKSTVHFKTIQPSDVCSYISSHPDVVLLDVRTKDEFEGKSNPNFGTLKNAINVPIQILQDRISSLDQFKNKDIIVYCSHSHRSPRASYILTQNGFTRITNMAGGMSEMKDRTCVK